MTDSVCYVLPSLYPSGGNKMCVEHVKRLARRGHFASVSIVSKHKEDDASWLEMDGVKIEPFTKAALEKYENVVATYWETYYHIKMLGLKGPKFSYFVQSKEEEFETSFVRKQRVLFSLMDPEFKKFTEAKWIKKYLAELLNQSSILVPNHIELPKDLVIEKRKQGKPFVLIEGEATTTWKNISFGAKVSNLLRPDCEVWLLTNTPHSKISPFIFTSFDHIESGLSWKEALELIGSADVVYRPSLLEGFNGCASEAMTLGVPVVVNKIPASYEQGIDGWNCLMVNPGNEYEAVSAIKKLLVWNEERRAIIQNAKETAAKYFTNWDDSIDILEDKVFVLG